MANSFFVPFNNQPVNTGRGSDSNSYTVPSGKFARVTITLCARAYVNNMPDVGGGVASIACGEDSTTLVIYMDEAEVLDFTASNASGSNGNGNDTANVNAHSQISADIGGSPIARVFAQANAYARITSGAFGSDWTISGDTEAYFRYEEYNKIS